MQTLKQYAIDFETFYSKEYSIADLGNYGYTHHPEFNAYMLSVAGDDGFEWVGSPADFDWKMLNGQVAVAHNAGFEAAVIARLKELDIVPQELEFAAFHDTADLAAYLGFPRSLAAAAEHLLGVKPDKGIRDKAKGKRWEDMTEGFKKDMTQYAMDDSRLELQLWLKYGHLWPDWEREISRLTREMCIGGLPVNLAALEDAISTLDALLWHTRKMIPWAEDPDAPALSPKSVALECRKHGIEPPKSMAKDSDVFQEWLDKHGKQFPWAKAMGSYRSINNFLKKLTTMRDRTVPSDYNAKDYPIMPYGLKYAGAHTLRDSGDTGFNVQNLPRGAMFAEEIKDMTEKESDGIDIRGLISAPEGKILGVVDLSAIEPRVITYFAEDWELLEMFSQGYDPYEAWARTAEGYIDPRPLAEVDSNLRKICKVKVLGLGYGAGAEKLTLISWNLAKLELDLAQATEIVEKFRARPFIPKLWRKLENAMRMRGGQDFTMELPSGREMRYRDVRNYAGLTAGIPRMGKMMRLGFWGGTLVENLVQATSRDIFMDGVLRLHQAGLPPILRVHDEAVCLLDEATAESDLKRMISILSTSPSWMQDLPVGAAGHLCKEYSKG